MVVLHTADWSGTPPSFFPLSQCLDPDPDPDLVAVLARGTDGLKAVWSRYGGVANRPNIAAAADWYVYTIQPLIDALDG
jgi:hypothetical protein